MTMYEFFVDVLGTPQDADVTIWCICAFAVLYAVIDFIHVFYSAIFSWFKK